MIILYGAAIQVGERRKTHWLQDMPKTRILLIPHQPNRNVKVRATEIARYLASHDSYEVFQLSWQTSARKPGNVIEKWINKLLECGRTLLTPRRIQAESSASFGVQEVTLPYLLAPYPFSQWFNQRQIERFMAQQRIDVIISANAYHFPMPQTPGMVKIYDVVDDHLSPDSGPAWRRTRHFTLKELKKADRIITISYALQAILSQEGFPSTTRIPNGVSWESFQAKPGQAVQAIRDRYQLPAGMTLTYIGNHGWWAGMDLLIPAFEQLQARCPQAKLLIVGPGEELVSYQRRHSSNPHIIFTGPISPQEIAAYFQVGDVGVLPFQLCPFTHNAMPLKVLEYGATQKPVVATPLRELETLRFPHVHLVEPLPEAWANTLEHLLTQPASWQPEWSQQIASYNWPIVLEPLEHLLADTLRERHAPSV